MSQEIKGTLGINGFPISFAISIPPDWILAVIQALKSPIALPPSNQTVEMSVPAAVLAEGDQRVAQLPAEGQAVIATDSPVPQESRLQFLLRKGKDLTDDEKIELTGIIAEEENVEVPRRIKAQILNWDGFTESAVRGFLQIKKIQDMMTAQLLLRGLHFGEIDAKLAWEFAKFIKRGLITLEQAVEQILAASRPVGSEPAAQAVEADAKEDFSAQLKPFTFEPINDVPKEQAGVAESQPIESLPGLFENDITDLKNAGITTYEVLRATPLKRVREIIKSGYRRNRIVKAANAVGIVFDGQRLKKEANGQKTDDTLPLNQQVVEETDNDGDDKNKNEQPPTKRMVEEGLAPAFAEKDLDLQLPAAEQVEEH